MIYLLHPFKARHWGTYSVTQPVPFGAVRRGFFLTLYEYGVPKRRSHVNVVVLVDDRG